MSFFSSILSQKQSTGARLLERLGSSTQLEDRRDALERFKELTTREPVRLVEKGGFSLLMGLVQDQDTQLVRDALETLVNLADLETPRESAESARVAGHHNCSVLLETAGHLGRALGATEDTDMYTRYHALQLLLKLLAADADATQAAVLSDPQTLARVLSLLDDKREIVRNEVLVVVTRLSLGNPELQNILVFQGAYERLLGFIESEAADGDSGAAIVVRDCFRIIGNLVEGKGSSRRFFCESGSLERIPPLLALPPAHDKRDAERVTLACRLLWQLLTPSEESEGGEADGAREAISKLRVVPIITPLLTNPHTLTEPALRAQALCSLSRLARGQKQNTISFELASSRVDRRHGDGNLSEALLPRLLHVALRSPPLYQAAALELLEAVLSEAEIQLAHALPLAEGAREVVANGGEGGEAVAHSADTRDQQPALGRLAVDSYLSAASACVSAARKLPGSDDANGSEGAQLWLSAGVLRALIQGNRRAKLALLRTEAAAAGGGGGGGVASPFFDRCVESLLEALSANAPPLVLVAMLGLLAELCSDCPEAVGAFSARTPNLPAIVDALTTSESGTSLADPHVRGHLAALLGGVLTGAPPTEALAGDAPALDPAPADLHIREIVLGMITRRVGLQAFAAAWEAMRSSGAYRAAAAAPALDASLGKDALEGGACAWGVRLYGGRSLALLQQIFSRANGAVLECYTRPDASPAATRRAAEGGADGMAPGDADGGIDPAIASFKEMIRVQDEKLRATQAELRDAQAELRDAQAELKQADAGANPPPYLELEADVSSAASEGEELGRLRREVATLEAQLGAAEERRRDELSKAEAALANANTELDAARRQIEEGGAIELQVWGGGYAGLCHTTYLSFVTHPCVAPSTSRLFLDSRPILSRRSP